MNFFEDEDEKDVAGCDWFEEFEKDERDEMGVNWDD